MNAQKTALIIIPLGNGYVVCPIESSDAVDFVGSEASAHTELGSSYQVGYGTVLRAVIGHFAPVEPE